MSAVEVEITKDAPEEEPTPRREADGASGARDRGRDRKGGDAQVEREVTKRELIRSVSNILVVILYMVFTLLRDRDAGVVLIDDDDGADDWED